MQVLLSSVMCSIIVFAASLSAQAQTSGGSSSANIGDALKKSEKEEAKPQADQSFQQAKEMKLIEVTGSYIKRVDEEGTSPVQTITAEQIKKSGHNSIADVLRETAYTHPDTRENSLSSSNPGVATASIGPFGADSILVLLNGQRLPKVGGENTVDLNMIPMASIERVEILKDGASALYGADAIGGVMNFITKKDFNGVGASINQNVSGEGGGQRTDVSVTVGKNFSKGNILGVVQYRNNSHLADQDRSFSRITNVKKQGSATGGFGSWQDMNVGANNPSAYCPPENQVEGLCRFDYSQYSWGIPDIQQLNTMVSGSYKVNEYLKSRTTASLVRREVQTRLAPPPDTMRISNATAVNVLNLKDAQGNSPTGDVILRYRLVDEAGARQNEDTSTTVNLAQTVEGKIAGSWTYDFSGSYGRTGNSNIGRGYANKAAIIKKIDEGKFNPLAKPGQKGDISDTLFTSTSAVTSSQSELKLVTTGQLYGGGEYMGPVAMAVGTSAAWQDFKNEIDPITASKNAYGTVGSFGEGQRNFQSVFQEISMFPVESVEVGLAGRYDNYSDFGGTFNPKLSVSWQASEKLLLRASAGTGFRAPNLVDLYNGANYGFPGMSDNIYCKKQEDNFGVNSPEANSACLYQQQLVNYSSNPNLKQESSVFYNLGFLSQPKKNWNVEGNFWIANIKDRVGSLDPSYAIQFEEQYGAAALESQYGIKIPRTPDGQLDPIGISMPSAFNLPQENLQGIDFRISRESKVNLAGLPLDVTLSVDHMHMLKSNKEDFPGLGVRGYRDINWRNSAIIGVRKDDHAVRFITRTISGGDKSRNEVAPGQGSLPTFTTHDITYSYSKLFGGQLNVGVRNLMAYNQPLDNTQFAPSDQLNGSVDLGANRYDPLGRTYYVGYDYRF